jgi:hypothetical protein
MRPLLAESGVGVRTADAGANHGMASRFPAPWRIVEIPNGFAVDDATGQQLGVFYGRTDPNIAGHTGFLTIEEARQMAVDFARLPELLERTPGSQRGRKSRALPRNAAPSAAQKDDATAARASIETR